MLFGEAARFDRFSTRHSARTVTKFRSKKLLFPYARPRAQTLGNYKFNRSDCGAMRIRWLLSTQITRPAFSIDLIKLLTDFIANAKWHVARVIYVDRSFDNNMIHYLPVIWKASTTRARARARASVQPRVLNYTQISRRTMEIAHVWRGKCGFSEFRYLPPASMKKKKQRVFVTRNTSARETQTVKIYNNTVAKIHLMPN